MMPLWLFIFLGALAVLSALGTVLQHNPVHCLLSLVVTLLVIGIMYIGLDAMTVGFLQMIVYAGAIMVLFLFVIWLLNLQTEVRTSPGHLALKAIGAVFCAALVAELFAVLWNAPTPAAGARMTVSTGYGSINLLATTLFSDYLIAFEVTSVLLLAAVVGAIALARRLPASGAGASTARGAKSMPSAGDGPRSAAAAQAAPGGAPRGAADIESARPGGA
jgi:NADH-quinone oxidoreductase subunit J